MDEEQLVNFRLYCADPEMTRASKGFVQQHKFFFNMPKYLVTQAIGSSLSDYYTEDLSMIKYVMMIQNNAISKEQIVIKYPSWSRCKLKGDYMIANYLFLKLIDFKKGEPIGKFLFDAGMLSWYLAHRLFVQRGNGAIVEWMILGLARYHGLIKLQTFYQKEELGWYMKALVTPRINDYAKVYHLHAFGNVNINFPYSDNVDYHI